MKTLLPSATYFFVKRSIARSHAIFFVALLVIFPMAGKLSMAQSQPASNRDVDLLTEVTGYFQSRKIQLPEVTFDRSARESILQRPDNETFFLRYAYALQRHGDKLLTESQRARLESVLETCSSIGHQWHDERNTLRCKYNERLWHFIGASPDDAPQLKRELEAWMKLRMLWTEQEHLAQYRFAESIWGLLDPQQQQKLLAGEWAEYVKQDAGHMRSDATLKILEKAIGKPLPTATFRDAATAWSKQRAELQQAVVANEANERRLVFAMDKNNVAMVMSENRRATDAYSRLFLAEAEAMRELVRMGYSDIEKPCLKAAEAAWQEAPQRFSTHARHLINLLTDSTPSLP